ncbi:MAG: hypothetical protein K1X94_08870 [Sandaracinaceae bacterium]|nr:hypothetical protein [Sandaracinaceae bacterium]
MLWGCPPTQDEPDADLDAARVRRDAPEIDAWLDPTLDADLDAVSPDAFTFDAPGLDAPGVDAVFFDSPPDAPIFQCEGVPVPAIPCSRDEECRAAGHTRCVLPVPGLDSCTPCMMLHHECDTAADCVARATTDAGPGPEMDDAGLDAGPPPDAGDPALLECHTYGAHCACPTTVCELPCVGADCPGSRCDTDGYTCPHNSTCTPSDPRSDDHGCAPRPCTSTADCECGFCTPLGLCANGAGRCE